MKFNKILILILTIILIISCSGSNDNEEQTPGIYGIAVDSAGNPIAGADVCVIPLTPPLPAIICDDSLDVREFDDDSTHVIGSCPNPFYDFVSIRFVLSNTVSGKIYIIENSSKDTVFRYINTFGAGSHVLQWTACGYDPNDTLRSRRPGIYNFILDADNKISKHQFIHDFKFDFIDCEIPQEVTKTDANGKFFLDYKWFPDYQEFNKIDETGYILGKFIYSKTADIIVRKVISEDNNSMLYLISTSEITIDKTKPINIKCQMIQKEVVK